MLPALFGFVPVFGPVAASALIVPSAGPGLPSAVALHPGAVVAVAVVPEVVTVVDVVAAVEV